MAMTTAALLTAGAAAAGTTAAATATAATAAAAISTGAMTAAAATSALAASGAAAGATLSLGSIMTGVSALSTIAGGVASYQQGQVAQEQADLEGRRLEVQGRMDAITTNEELLKTMSMNTVAAAAGGLAGSGSVQRAQEQSQANAAKNLSISKMNTQASVASAKASGKNKAAQGTAGLLGSFVQAGTTVYGAAKSIKKT